MLICPEANSAQNSMAAVSADGSTVWGWGAGAFGRARAAPLTAALAAAVRIEADRDGALAKYLAAK
jgi:hypothetical protein